MKTTNRRNTRAVALSILAIIALIATAAAMVPATPRPAFPHVVKAAPMAPIVGVATGESVNGVPVYRLPSINVTASRSVELAKIAAEERVAVK